MVSGIVTLILCQCVATALWSRWRRLPRRRGRVSRTSTHTVLPSMDTKTLQIIAFHVEIVV